MILIHPAFEAAGVGLQPAILRTVHLHAVTPEKIEALVAAGAVTKKRRAVHRFAALFPGLHVAQLDQVLAVDPAGIAVDGTLHANIITSVNQPDSVLARRGLIATPGAWGKSIQGNALVSIPPSIPVDS